MSSDITYDQDPTKFTVHFLREEGLEAHSERVTASFAFILDDNKRMLALKNERGWDIPGGHLEQGEDAVTAAKREVLEEACVDIEEVTPFALIKNADTAMAVFIARSAAVHEFIPNKDDPTSDRTFMKIADFMVVYSGGDKVTMSKLIEELAIRTRDH